MPVRITAENKGPDLNARVQVSVPSTTGGSNPVYAADLSLPATSRKEFFIYAYTPSYAQQVTVSLWAGDRVLQTIPLRISCLAGPYQLVGLLVDDPASVAPLVVAAGSTNPIHATLLQLADLPDRAQGWEGLDALVVSGVDMGNLSGEKRTAMHTWLARGGRLMIAGGPKWQLAAGGLKDFLPLDLNGTRSVGSLSGLSTYLREPQAPLGDAILAVGPVRPGASVLADQDGTPVLVQQQIGLGMVYFLAADPGLQPLSQWPGMQKLYSLTLAERPAQPPWASGAWNTPSANRALASLPGLALPSAGIIFFLLGVYVLIVGPLNYFILRRLKRPELSWLTIPALIMVFTVAAYVSGAWVRGIQPALNRLSVVQAWPGVDQAWANGLVGIYSPGRDKYSLQSADPFLLHPFDNTSYSTLPTAANWLSVQQGSNTVYTDVLVESGALQTVTLSGSTPALSFIGDLSIELGNQDAILVGQITNASNQTLHDASLVTSGNYAELGTIAPGETKQVRVSLAVGHSGPSFYSRQYASPYSALGPQKTDLTAARQAALLEAVMAGAGNSYYSSGSRGQNEGNWGIFLVGWLDQAVLPASLQGRSNDAVDTTFYAAMLSPTFKAGAGPLRIGPGLFIWDTSVPNYSPYGNDYQEMPTDGYALSFRLAAPLHYSAVKSLSLNLAQGTGYSSSTPKGVEASLWDWDKAAWVRVQHLVWGNTNIPNPARYVGPGTEIRLKLAPDASQSAVQVRASTFTLVVDP